MSNDINNAGANLDLVKKGDTTTAAATRSQEGNEFYVKFRKPFVFEGKEYMGLDLSGLEDLRSEDIFEVQKDFQTHQYITPRPEADMKYCCMVAAAVSGVPEEFFDGLPAKESMRVRNVVQTFFQSED